MPSTRQQIELWKTRLLDLSRRNRLLNARHGLSNLLALTHPAVDSLFDALVRRRRRLPFAAALTLEERLAALSWDTPATGVTMRLDRIPIPPPRPDQLATDVQPAEQERVLYNMRLRARTALTEQGVNILFVALGFLEWFAPEDSEAVLRSPLLLLPVEIQRAPLGVEYALKLLDDEIVLNPTLAHKLRKDYGLALPELPEDDDDLHPEQIFAQISELIAGHDGWQVLPEAALGLFSFLKLLMYHDLERAAIAGAHPILALLAGDKAHVGGENPLILNAEPPAEPLDSRPPEACYQVLDADSSQAEAIAAARAGASFVLQGPPGTGKSQTIANIIAECMAAGQRVLFVSEKMAALQVVFERLKRCGLDAFCLELHSHKANKRDVLAALGAALDAPPAPAPAPFPHAELATTRDQLNAYARALHTPYGPLRWTAYTAHARAASLADAPDCDAPLGDLDTFTAERIGAIDVLLAKLDARRELLQSLPGNLWRGCAITTGSFEQRGRIRARLRALIAALGELERVARALAERFGLPAPEGIAAARKLAALAGLLREPQSDAFWIAAPEASTGARDAIAAARRQYTELSEMEARLGQRHQPAVLDGDLDPLLQRFTGQYASWARMLRPQYHRDMAALRATLQPGAALDYASALADLHLAADVAARRREEAERVPALAARLGPLFSRHTTDWDALQANYDWATRLLALALPRPLPAPLREAAATPQPTRTTLLADSSQLDTALAKLDEELAFFETLFPTTDDRRPTTDSHDKVIGRQGDMVTESGDTITMSPPHRVTVSGSSVVSGRWSVVGRRDVPRLLERMGDLDAWWEFCELRRATEPLGIVAYLDALGTDPEAAAQPRRAFHKHFCQIWLDAAYDRLSPLRHFRHDQHAALIARFGELDTGQLTAAQERLRHLLAARRPPPTSAVLPGSELAILRRELQKQRRHKPIRQLFREIPALLGQLKPCLLMSPLSVSQFLDPDAIRFDLVIFDEASQIRTEEAVGAVLRGTALVVVGDNKQLPPTSFFVADAEDLPETDESEAPDSFESILDASSASGLPSRLLSWHYRSRDEALITFSNTHFYGGRLATFPGAARLEGQGVSFEHVADGCYDRQGTRTNLAEARRVADLVAAHFQTTPARSLGVVAFSQAQQLAILHELERRRAADESLAILFDEGRTEPFFVKNLENVQGDERDVMIVSVGYGRDAAGRLLMNFGPLNQQGGERRLNVAITRARERAVLVSSLLPEDIDLRRTQHPGPRLLRAYIEYARRGGPGGEMRDGRLEIAEPSGRISQSPISHLQSPPSLNTRFEDDLAAALVRHGLELARQIGHSDFRIDIAIRDPRDPARFLLGVECDGADYRDAPTARDRERLREQVLGTLGWRIHRAWSAAWAQDAESEVRRVLAALEGPAKEESSAPET